MRLNDARFITPLSLVCGMLFLAAPSHAQSCEAVSGTISTNFVDTTTTVGTATGGIAGGVSAVVQNVIPGNNGKLSFFVVHRFVTTSGDVLVSQLSEGVALPSNETGMMSLTFTKMDLQGKSGRYEGATGTLKLFGGANLDRGEVVVHYRGQICFAPARL
jgi:hypothetical protein